MNKIFPAISTDDMTLEELGYDEQEEQLISDFWKLLDRVSEKFEDEFGTYHIMCEIKRFRSFFLCRQIRQDENIRDRYEKKIIEWIIKHKFSPGLRTPYICGYSPSHVNQFYLFTRHPDRDKIQQAFKYYFVDNKDKLDEVVSNKIILSYLKLNSSYPTVASFIDNSHYMLLDDDDAHEWFEDMSEDKIDRLSTEEEIKESIKYLWAIMEHWPNSLEEFFFVKKVCPDTGAILELDREKIKENDIRQERIEKEYKKVIPHF